MVHDKGALNHHRCHLTRWAASLGLCLCVSIFPAPGALATTLRWQMGAGNIVTFRTGAETAPLYRALQWVGARLGRMDSYGWRNLQRVPTPNDFDAAMMEAHDNGITHVLRNRWPERSYFVGLTKEITRGFEGASSHSIHLSRSSSVSKNRQSL